MTLAPAAGLTDRLVDTGDLAAIGAYHQRGARRTKPVTTAN
jgi:hypothetical protein